MTPEMDLTNRQAICGCGKKVPSSPSLPFFEYRGPGSEQGAKTCHCGYYECAHDAEHMARNVPSNRRTLVEQGKCTGFVSRGSFEFDSYFCGHSGWD